MIACSCRSLFRVDLSWKVTNSFVILSSVRHFQRCSFYHIVNHSLGIDTGEGLLGSMDQQKQKKVSCVCRKVSTQSSRQEEYVVKGAKIDSEHSHAVGDGEKNKVRGQVKKVRHSIPSHMARIKREKEVDVKPTTSAEKHSILVHTITSTGRYSTTIEVGASLIRFIKGKRGATQKEIEEETGATIIFPSSRKDDSIIIEGDSTESVTRASRRIQIIIEEAVNSRSLDYSHFVSLPLAAHPELVDKLVKFQNSILGISGVEQELGIDRSIFITPKTFHLTVLMLKLWNKDRVEAAAKILQTVLSKVMDALDSRPISIRLKGLECMRGSFAKAYVLYAPVEEVGGEGRLLRACQVIIDAFVEAGLVPEKDAQQKLKLHATVMNARHRKRNTRTKKVDFFDARGIVDLYGSAEWGEYVICEAHLSQRFVYDENGYYHCCASIPFT